MVIQIKYKCNDCEEIFDEDEIEYVDESFCVPYGEGSVVKEEYSSHCPYCDSEDFDEYYEDDEDD